MKQLLDHASKHDKDQKRFDVLDVQVTVYHDKFL